MESAENGRSWSIWPLLGFRADWPKHEVRLSDGFLLVKADKASKTVIDKTCNERIPVADVTADFWQYDWLLAVSPPGATQEIPVKDLGIDIAHAAAYEYVQSFFTSLRITGISRVSLPPFEYSTCGDPTGPDLSTMECIDFDEYYTDIPRFARYSEEKLTEKQVCLLLDVWTGVSRLRKLDDWREFVFSEQFAAHELDKKASERALKSASKPKELLKEMSGEYFTEEEWEKIWEEMPTILAELGENGQSLHLDHNSPLVQKKYKKFVRLCFEKHKEMTENRTRLGRAITIFDDGCRLHLSSMHTFLSMCIVMETLYSTEGGEIAHKIRTRACKLLQMDHGFDERKRLYDRVNNVYKARSHIVHGVKMFDKINAKTIRDGTALARLSIQELLCNDELFDVFTKDEKNKKDAVEEFFLRLDIGN